jgi:peptidoglycan/xylan/chitin deacetylase (PgdA/CDA1 family)
VSPSLFEEQVRWIGRHFDVIHPRTLTEGGELPARAALITFDDGFEGTFLNALPILARFGFPCAVFMNMGHVADGTPLLSAHVSLLTQDHPRFAAYCASRGLPAPYHLTVTPTVLSAFLAENADIPLDRINAYTAPMVGPDLLREWAASPDVVLGNHLYRHWNFSALTDQEFREEFARNHKALAQLGHDSALFAYTNGVHPEPLDAVHEQVMRGLGVRSAFTSRHGVNPAARGFFLGRIPISPGELSSARLWFRVAQAVVRW